MTRIIFSFTSNKILTFTLRNKINKYFLKDYLVYLTTPSSYIIFLKELIDPLNLNVIFTNFKLFFLIIIINFFELNILHLKL